MNILDILPFALYLTAPLNYIFQVKTTPPNIFIANLLALVRETNH